MKKCLGVINCIKVCKKGCCVTEQKKRKRTSENAKQTKSTINKNAHDELTQTEKAFCINYVKTFNVKNSARHAGIKASDCMQEGFEMFNKPQVREYIKALKKQQHESMMAEGNDIVQKYLDIAFADIFDFVQLGCVAVSADSSESSATGIFIKNDDGIQLFLPDIIDGSLVAEIKQGKDGITIKLADRMKALAWLTDYFELNPADVHRREADKRKIELAAVKICPQDLEQSSDNLIAQTETLDMPHQMEKKQTKDKQQDTVQTAEKQKQKADNYEQALKQSKKDLWKDE